MSRVFIGVDPHKLSATIEVVDDRETVLATGRFATDKAGVGHIGPGDYPARALAGVGLDYELVPPGYCSTYFGHVFGGWGGGSGCAEVMRFGPSIAPAIVFL